MNFSRYFGFLAFVFVIFFSSVWAEEGTVATPTCPEEQMSVLAEEKAKESGMDARSLLEAMRGFCLADDSKGLLAAMWRAYAEYHTRVAYFKKEFDAFPMDRMKELEERGGRIPSDLVDPMRRLGSLALMTMTSSSNFYQRVIEVNTARFNACGNDYDCRLKAGHATLGVMERSLANIKALEPYLFSFSLMAVVEEGWTCCINMSAEGRK